ncbi:MAG: hypothetical protein GW898_10760 [Thiomicrospira sp.]|nr:hypothetical protein [Thiomicrospira sp.]NCN66384.1 hypothetical protein [Thiomicrospira sp.]NCO14838.1 hypothetical protein [Thiomicrospira sp.]NCO82434.1 hypothetical protein [Thiomicrospira sp.]OIP95436.1 MAG: hypothetical protein AUK56_05195 [Thiomicrospira sp. CG2_30_44_34]
MGDCILFDQRYSIEICRNNPNTIFVFGDNRARKGTGGQAIIRGEPNAFGVITKLLPAMHDQAFIRDTPEHRELVISDLRRLYALWQSDPLLQIAFPIAGIGTGLARMQETAPHIFGEMNAIISRHFLARERVPKNVN